MKLRNAILLLLVLLFGAGTAAAQSPGDFTLFRDMTGGDGKPNPHVTFPIPTNVGEILTINNKDFHAVFANNTGIGYFFGDDPRDTSGEGQKDEVVLTIKRTGVNTAEVWGDLRRFSVPTYADLYPRGGGPVFRFTARWATVNGEIKLTITNEYILMGYLDVNDNSSKPISLPSEFKGRLDLRDDVWTPANGPRVTFGASASSGCSDQSGRFTVMLFELTNKPGSVAIGQFSIRP